MYDRTCPGYREAYALANVVPSSRTQTTSTTAPSLQVNTTGRITFDTPVVSDTVVNEVITRPAATPTATNTARANEPVSQSAPAPAEKKMETKAEAKQEVKQTVKPQVKAPSGKTIEMPTIVQTPVKIEQVQLIDLLSTKIINRPMNTNPRAYYLMTIGGQRTHEDMIDEQFRERN
jgi:ribosomal protein L12E/L44/L45/RPP1/RPP2